MLIEQSINRDPLIMLKILPIMLCYTAQKFLPIMLELCSIFIPQLSCFDNKLALLWVNSKYLKLRLQILALLKRKDWPILIEQSALYFCITVIMTVLLEYIDFFYNINSMAQKSWLLCQYYAQYFQAPIMLKIMPA